MDVLLSASVRIKEEARRLGFDGCGIARAEELVADARRLDFWLKHHYHGGMAYLENFADKRVDPTKLVGGAQSVISVLLNYFPAAGQTDPAAPVVAKYAYGRDYHEVVREKLARLLHYVNCEIAPAGGRIFVDSAPLLEKAWAARAGLGWIGKNSCLISPKIGSFCFIGEIVTDLPVSYDQPVPDYCGSCTRCLEFCPTGALVAPRLLDSRRCIAYLTIESKDQISPEFNGRFANRVFGCDICQDVCPWNKQAPALKEVSFIPASEMLSLTRGDWHKMDKERFNRLFSRSALKRAKFSGLRRNLDFIASAQTQNGKL